MAARGKYIRLFTLLAVLAAVLFVVDILTGSQLIPAGKIVQALLGNGDDAVIHSVVNRIRLPRAVTAVAVGAALSASGLQMQTLFRNPLAGPYVLGVSSGASMGVALFLLGIPLLGGIPAGYEWLRNLGMASAAWIGAAALMAVIMAVSVRIKDVMTILILGMMVGSAVSAFVEILQYLSSESALKTYVVWTMGSLEVASISQLKLLAGFAGVGLALSIALIKPLNLLSLGENYASTMGLNVRRARILIFLSTSLLAGTVTAFCGPIGFIGIAVPHVARMVLRNADHRTLMPATMLLGAGVMLLCDIISKLPGHDMILPINTVTALLGIPIVVLVIVRNNKFF